jgi:hypothetical protein
VGIGVSVGYTASIFSFEQFGLQDKTVSSNELLVPTYQTTTGWYYREDNNIYERNVDGKN